MIVVSQLHIYPIKSLGGIALQSVQITRLGFEHDRRWMLVDDNGRFISQRESAEMALLKISLAADGLLVQHQQETDDTLHIAFGPYQHERITTEIWGQYCEAIPVGKDADAWFSKKLGMRCRLVYMMDDAGVKVDERYSINNALTAFSDGYPILMAGEASLSDFNTRSTEPVPMNRFRANLIISGSSPYEEDTMQQFTINDLCFYGVKPSSRCVVTTIDQATAKKGKEPLKTLATYRAMNHKIYFGENVIATGIGRIQVGDEVVILKTKQSIFQNGL